MESWNENDSNWFQKKHSNTFGKWKVFSKWYEEEFNLLIFFKKKGATLEDSLVSYAHAINTSPKVLHQHYIRSNYTAQNLETIEAIDDQIFGGEEASLHKTQLDQLVHR